VRAAAADPRGFLELHPPPVIFDEIQHALDLLPYIKERIDARRSARGQYLLTGSQNLLLAEQVTESLAGRAAMLRLLPLAQRELSGLPEALLPWETGRIRPKRQPLGLSELWFSLLRGGYPELAVEPGRDLGLWHASYIQTYLERDVRALRQIGDLTRGQDPQLYFWRTTRGVEVDLIVETGAQLIPIEVKLTATPHPGMAAGIKAFQEEMGRKAGPGLVVHPGDARLPLAPNVRSLPFAEL